MIRLAIAFTMALSLLGIGMGQSAYAVTGAEFQAGRIIDDGVFYNGGALGAGEIQGFLNARVPSCDTNGTQPYAGTTRAAYGTSRGYPPPYTCLKDFSQDTPTRAAETGLCNQYNGGTKSAAQIIYDVGVACGISQKALIVLLEKEQALISDDWPWSIQYRSATGYGCPDTAPCDAEYYGFFNQVFNAARQFKRYVRDESSFRYRAFRNNFIQYSPNAACGGTDVFIKNQATAGLYNYTPYQPNTSALSNLYGSGDSCGAYGNRNFWRLYSDWFGNTFGDPFTWQPISTRFYDQEKNTELPSSNVKSGERLFISLKVKNTGSEIWYRDGPNPAILGTSDPLNHASGLCESSWLSCKRTVKILEESIVPGAEGHFEFYITIPPHRGDLRSYFRPVLENRAWMTNDTGYHIYNKVVDDFEWTWASFNAWVNSGKTIPADLNNLARNQTIYIDLFAKNTSASYWYSEGNNPISVGTSNPLNRTSSLCDGSWLTCNRPALVNQPLVKPGQTASFSFSIKTSGQLGESREFFKPLSELNAWMRDDFNHIYLRVTQ